MTRGDVFLIFMVLGALYLIVRAIIRSLHVHGPEGAARLKQISDLFSRSRFERKRTRILTGGRDRIVGDVSQAQWPKAHYPHSRANVKGGM